MRNYLAPILFLSFFLIISGFEEKRNENDANNEYLISLIRKRRQSNIETTIASTVATVIVESNNLPCTAVDCNERGSCFGTKASPLCFCQLGFAGKNCQDTYCESARDCSGRGWCMGTSSQYTCLCNIGFSGEHCNHENPIPLGPVAVVATSTSTTQSTPPQHATGAIHLEVPNSPDSMEIRNFPNK